MEWKRSFFFDWNHSNYALCYVSRLILGMFLAQGSFFLPDRPTAVKFLVKNPPFKESIDCCLIYFFISLSGPNIDCIEYMNVHTLSVHCRCTPI